MRSSANHIWRYYLVLVLGFFFMALVVVRLFNIQLAQHGFYQALAQNQHQIARELLPKRGEIFIQDKYSDKPFPIAINREELTLYVAPKQIKDSPQVLAESLANILQISIEEILPKLQKKDDPFEVIKTKLSKQETAKIKDLNCSALGLLPVIGRYYPANNLASQTIGYLGYSNDVAKGQYGIEGYYEDVLKGDVGWLNGVKDVAGSLINIVIDKAEQEKDGADLILTIDQNIQFMIEEKLAELVNKWQAQEGSIIVMEPTTGAIRGLANWPNFDLNQYGKVANFDVFLNSATQKLYEPGSIFKPIVMAAGLAEKKITPNTTYNDMGLVVVADRKIHNAQNKSYGQQTMTQVIEKSLNTGAVFVEQQVGDQVFLDYIKRFGFDQKTGIDLSGERAGDIKNLLTGRPINFATASFGQGIAVTPMELVSGIGAIANQGKLMRPYLVAEQVSADGQREIIQPKIRGEAISPEVAATLTQMLVDSVANGFAKQAGVPGYRIAGKTGTAQISNPEGGYFEDRSLHSFIGFGPADDPQFVVLILLNSPQGVSFASIAVAPAFRDVAKYLLDHYHIAPEE